MIRQVMAVEAFIGQIAGEDAYTGKLGQLIFGTHDHPFFADDDGVVNNAYPLDAQEIRIVLDERIPTWGLDEIMCDNGDYILVPSGTSPAEQAACASSQPSQENCLVGICQGRGGYWDLNGDRVPDFRRLHDYDPDPLKTEYAIIVECDGVSVPLDPKRSGYLGDGTQVFDEEVGHRSLGPVLIAMPAKDGGLRTNATCEIRFRPELTDEDGNRICAPEGGRIAEGCTDGDTSRIPSFGTDSLVLLGSLPEDGTPSWPPNISTQLSLIFNAPVPDGPISGISLTTNGVPVDVEPFRSEDRSNMALMFVELSPDTAYEFSAGAGFVDHLGGEIVTPVSVSFMTRSQ